MKLEFEVDFKLGDIVILKTDIKKEPRILVGYKFINKNIIYILCSGVDESSHYNFEIETIKNSEKNIGFKNK